MERLTGCRRAYLRTTPAEFLRAAGVRCRRDRLLFELGKFPQLTFAPPRPSLITELIGICAYTGASSTMRPSLQPYLASKSSFTVALAGFAAAVHDACNGVELGVADPDLDLRLRLDVAHPVCALVLGNKIEVPAMLSEPDLDFTGLTGDAASGGQVEVHRARRTTSISVLNAVVR